MKSPNPQPAALNILLASIQAGALLEKLDRFSDLGAAIAHAQATLTSADSENDLSNHLDAFIAECASNDHFKAVRKAFDEEALTLKNGDHVADGDVIAIYAEPAFVFGLALGLCIAAGAGEAR